jgi:hypothetical protein
MATQKDKVMTLIPMNEKQGEGLIYQPQPDSKEFRAIFSEQQRHQWIMQAGHDKSMLAATLAKEIGMHVTSEVKELLLFLYDELKALEGHPEVHAAFLGFIQQDGRQMMNELSAIRKAGVHGVFEAVNWSLNILPPQEHRTFWDWLLGRKK